MRDGRDGDGCRTGWIGSRRLTGDKRYADWVAAQLDFYAENYLRWPLQNKNGKSRLMGQSLDDAA